MIDNFIEEIFGVSPMTFVIITAFWAFFFVIVCGDDKVAGFATCVMVFITAWLFGKLGSLLFFTLIIFILGLAIFFIFIAADGGARTTAPYSSFQSKSSISTGYQSYTSQINVTPGYLYHGTSSINAAMDIVTRNRWLVRDHSPRGIYMTPDFNTAAGYSGTNGAVVEIFVSIPPSLIVNYSNMPGDSNQMVNMGYRLIRMGNIYIAPVPTGNYNNPYYRVEGLQPLRVLDRNKNPITMDYRNETRGYYV